MRRQIALYLMRTQNLFILKRIKAVELTVLIRYAARAFRVSRPKVSAKNTLEAFALFNKKNP